MLNKFNLFDFEKWYFDAQDENGTFIFFFLASFSLFGIKSGQFIFALFPKDSKPKFKDYSFSTNQLHIDNDKTSGHFGIGEFSSKPEDAFFAFHYRNLDFRIDYNQCSSIWIPENNGTLLNMNNSSLRWIVPIPRANVKVNLNLEGKNVSFNGYGYHDYVKTNIPPWKIPLKELLWGRAIGKDFTAIWNRPVFKIGSKDIIVKRGLYQEKNKAEIISDILETEVINQKLHKTTKFSYPDKMKISMSDNNSNKNLNLSDTKLLLGENVADVAKFGNAAERWMYRTFTGNPIEYKLLSKVSVEKISSNIFAAHEKVLWGRNNHS